MKQLILIPDLPVLNFPIVGRVSMPIAWDRYIKIENTGDEQIDVEAAGNMFGRIKSHESLWFKVSRQVNNFVLCSVGTTVNITWPKPGEGPLEESA